MRGGMTNSNNEPMNLTKSRIREPEAGAVARRAGEDVKNRAEKRVEVGKGGCEIGKWRSFSHFETVFSHLFPRFSTQVVDFPHLGVVSIFWEEGFHRRDAETQSQEETGTNQAGLEVLPDGHCGEAELI